MVRPATHSFTSTAPYPLHHRRLQKHHALTLKVAFREDASEEEEGAAAPETPATAHSAAATTVAATPVTVTAAPPLPPPAVPPPATPAALPPAAPPATPAPAGGVEGIPPAILGMAREIVVATQTCSLRHLMTTLREYEAPAVPRGTLELPAEAARRVLRHLEATGVVALRPGGKYDIVAAHRAAPRAIRPPPSSAATPPSSSSLGSLTVRDAVATPPPKAALAVAGGTTTSTTSTEALVYARAVGEAAQAGDNDAAAYITTPGLAAAVGVDDATARGLVTRLAEVGWLASKPVPGHGWPVSRTPPPGAVAALLAAMEVLRRVRAPSLPRLEPVARRLAASVRGMSSSLAALCPPPPPQPLSQMAGMKRAAADDDDNAPRPPSKRPAGVRGVRFADEVVTHTVPAAAPLPAIATTPARTLPVMATSVGWGAAGVSMWRK